MHVCHSTCEAMGRMCSDKHCSSLYTRAGPPQNVSLNATSSMTLHLEWEEPELDSWDGTVNGYGIDCTSHFMKLKLKAYWSMISIV